MKKVYILAILLFILTFILFLGASYKKNINISDNFFVSIEAFNAEHISKGSGFVYKINDNKNYILTSYHVIEDYDEVYVYNKEKVGTKAKILGYDEYTDIAIIEINDELSLKSCDVGKSYNIKNNDKIYYFSSDRVLSSGNILNTQESVIYNTTHGNSTLNVIKIRASITKGNSGGPLLDNDGNVIGLIFSKQSDDENIGFALPIDFVIDIVSKLENQELKRPNLGATFVNSTNEEILKEYDITPEVEGVVIIGLDQTGILYNSGFIEGDIIVSLNDIKIYNVTQFREELYKHNIGDEIKLSFYRHGIISEAILKLK